MLIWPFFLPSSLFDPLVVALVILVFSLALPDVPSSCLPLHGIHLVSLIALWEEPPDVLYRSWTVRTDPLAVLLHSRTPRRFHSGQPPLIHMVWSICLCSEVVQHGTTPLAVPDRYWRGRWAYFPARSPCPAAWLRYWVDRTRLGLLST